MKRFAAFLILGFFISITSPLVAEEVTTVAAEQVVEKKASFLENFNDTVSGLLFFDISGGVIKVDDYDRKTGEVRLDPETGELLKKSLSFPFLVAFLALGAVIFTLLYRFINIRMFKHGIDVVRGKYDNPDDVGEISHFQALTSALSGTVGLGNIAGVAVAIYLGGAGAVFWMATLAIFGMTAKFSSSTLAQVFRKQNADGSLSGGPMYYLDLGLKKIGLAPLGKILGVMYAVMIMLAAVGGGNMFQSNQTYAAIEESFLKQDLKEEYLEKLTTDEREKLQEEQASERKVNQHTVGIIMAFFVGLVVVGGVKRIGAATSKLIPTMCALYIVASLYVILSNFSEIPNLIVDIFSDGLSGEGLFGGAVGALIVGFQRAAFSNEAGLGSASIVHAAAKTDEPVREGIVSMLGPVIDTIIVCSMTALVILVTKMHINPEIIELANGGTPSGSVLTSRAFESSLTGSSKVLTICIILFAFSTMISWCYYGERGWVYLMDHFGEGAGIKSIVVFRIIFVIFVWVGAVNSFDQVLTFTDLMILSLCFPNIIGSLILAPKVMEMTKDYVRRYKSGEMKTYK